MLAIAAAKLGFEPGHARRPRREAVEATRENAAANGVARRGALADALDRRAAAADVAVANIALDVVEAFAARLDCGALVASGYLAARRRTCPAIAATSRREREGWAADSARTDASKVRAHGDLLGPLPRLQGLARRRAGGPRAAARGRPRRARRRRRRRRRQHVLRHARGGAQVAPGGARAPRARTARVYVTGCAANLAGDAFAGLPDNVVVVARAARRRRSSSPATSGAIGCVQADARLDRVRAFVKVQDGCSFSCTFCVIPLVRGASRSRRAEAVLAEIRRRVEQGHREVVLTGINLGCYRDRAAGYDLPRLVREAGATPGLARLRLSSIEINHVNDGLVAALRETPTVSRHLHVPLQSGDDGVLRAMGRRYTAATYLRRLDARARLQPDHAT